VQHQRQEAERLGLLGQQRGQQPAQPNAFIGERPARRFAACRIRPALGKCRIDGIEHGCQPRRELAALGHGQGNAGFGNLALGAHQALAHGRGRGQEGRGDGGGVEAEHRLQHQWRADVRGDGRVGAGEHQRQAVVGDVVHRRRGIHLLRQQPHVRAGSRRTAPSPRHVGELATGDGQQPGLGGLGNAARRPDGEGRGKGIGQRVLGLDHVARARGEEGQ
jgi:hypothetical protein